MFIASEIAKFARARSHSMAGLSACRSYGADDGEPNKSYPRTAFHKTLLIAARLGLSPIKATTSMRTCASDSPPGYARYFERNSGLVGRLLDAE